MKRKQAIIAAALITGLLAFGLLAVGVNAVFNPNSVPVSNSPATAASVSGSTANSSDAQAQIQQLTSLIAQYQAREAEYQSQLSQAESQVQQLESVLIELQRAGVIRIQSDGTIRLGRGGFSGNSFPATPNGGSNAGPSTAPSVGSGL
jgi:septal ring factor EnvC (AmiA/AmiB activator)